MISSNRFRNSGLKVRLTSFLTRSSTLSEIMSSLVDWKPRPSRFCKWRAPMFEVMMRSEEHTTELQSLRHIVCCILLEKNESPKHIVTHRLLFWHFLRCNARNSTG